MRNKLTFPIAIILFFIATPSKAQFFLSKSKAKVSSIRFYAGGFFDNYANLSPEGLLSTIRSDQSYDFDLDNYREVGGYPVVMEGSIVGFDISFNPISRSGDLKVNREIRLGASLNFDREVVIDMIERNQPIDMYYYTNAIGLCLIENEFMLQGAYLFKLPLIGSLNIYGGPEARLGTTFNNEFIFLSGGDAPLRARNSTYIRTSAVAGIGVEAFRIQLQLEGQFGGGAQIVYGGEDNVFRTHSVRFSVGYRLLK